MRKLILTAAVLALATPAAAQSTGTPVFAAPYRAFRASELGLSLSDPGSGVALEGFYKVGQKTWDLGVRGGFWDTDGAGTAVLLGVDGRTRAVTHSESFPLDGAFTLGAGAVLHDNANLFMVPVGLSLGRRVDLEGSTVSFVPYFQPVLTPVFGSGNSDMLFSIGLGADIRVQRDLDLRVSGALGDMDGISISAAFLH
ncbi:MAG TPA: hypothetical protein VFS07_02535 [Gemmatimonadales bacterium]|jgi:hypothetical protein|nr:hypothetical protein [Gemmatimonadales bacterium]